MLSDLAEELVPIATALLPTSEYVGYPRIEDASLAAMLAELRRFGEVLLTVDGGTARAELASDVGYVGTRSVPAANLLPPLYDQLVVSPSRLLSVGVAGPWSVGCERSGSTRILVRVFCSLLGDAILIAPRLWYGLWSGCRFEYGTLPSEEFVERLGEIAQQLPAVGHLWVACGAPAESPSRQSYGICGGSPPLPSFGCRATSLSFLRVGEWLMGIPKAATRRSPFARLMAGPLAA